MTEKDLKIINDLAKTRLAQVKNMSNDEARQVLVNAGIFNNKGEYTAPYKNLSKAVKKAS